jgi:hypothetical protein
MAKMENNLNIVISGPRYGDVARYANFLRCTTVIGQLVDSLPNWEPDIADQIKSSSLLHSGVQLDGGAIGGLGLLISGDLVSGGRAVSIKAQNSSAAAFCILEGCGFFVPDPSCSKSYHFAIPKFMSPVEVKESALRLLESNDEEGILHPESIVSCVAASDLLATRFWSEHGVRRLIEAASMAAGDNDVEGRLAAVGTMFEQIPANRPASRAARLEEFLDQEAVLDLVKWIKARDIRFRSIGECNSHLLTGSREIASKK